MLHEDMSAMIYAIERITVMTFQFCGTETVRTITPIGKRSVFQLQYL